MSDNENNNDDSDISFTLVGIPTTSSGDSISGVASIDTNRNSNNSSMASLPIIEAFEYISIGEDSSSRSVASLPIIEEFEYISIGGDDMRMCKRCHFLNASRHNFCQTCGLLLYPSNLSLVVSMDAQIARNLQIKEEQKALYQLQFKEKERQELQTQSLLLRAQRLAMDIHTCIQNLKRFDPFQLFQCYEGVPVPALTMLALKFIEFHDSHVVLDLIGYHYSTENVERIHQVGFGPNASFVTKPYLVTTQNKGGWYWIAAIVQTVQEMEADEDEEDGLLLLHIVATTEQSLPLLRFPAGHVISNTMTQVSNGM